jgi:hypothetical protein
MELNHQIRLCRPFPILFGFRAIFFTQRGVTVKNKAFRVSSSIRKTKFAYVPGRDSPFPLHKVHPPKDL